MRFFGTKTWKTSNVGKTRKKDEEKMSFSRKKTFSSFEIAPLPTWEGAKYAGGSRSSCLISKSSFSPSGQKERAEDGMQNRSPDAVVRGVFVLT